MTATGMKKTLRTGFDAALVQVPEALKAEGFGVLTEIDVQDTIKKKLGLDFRRYRIFGACNPPLAHQALTSNIEAGLMMPCNLVLFEADDGSVVASAVDPMRTMAATDPVLFEVARQVSEKLGRVLDRLE